MILIIDKKASDALIAQHVLSEQGNTCLISKDVFEALRIYVALEKSLDFVLMKLYMPD